MSRWEFMRQLEELLSDIAPAEREEALQYYNDYFNDAGKENEQDVIQSLGTPQHVAQIVKDGLNENSSQGEFTENGFQSKQQVQDELAGKKSKNDLPTWAIVLIIIACVLLSPAILGVLASVIGALIGVITAAIGIVFGIAVSSIALFIVAISLVIAGIGTLFPHPFAGIGLIGVGFICAALGILFMLLTAFFIVKCIPAICEGTMYFFGEIKEKVKGARA